MPDNPTLEHSGCPHPITPNSPTTPRPYIEHRIPHEPPNSSLPHRPPEPCIRQPGHRIWYLKPQATGLKPIGLRRMLHYAVSDDVARMDDVFVAGFEVDLVQEAFTAQG